ncbi:YncE family protein [Paracoccus versutus]|uniref:YncE family protein n=1 Tax=Paracoccus versutus TaxID=34007 RepID=UPI000DF767F1|nr:YncE family protein [Paracoccus versutus]RDD70420.1 YncE family protein [Paracoccus versutus]
MRHSSLRLATALAASLLCGLAAHAEQAAPAPQADPAAVRQDSRIRTAALAQGLYELVHSPRQGALFAASAGGFGENAAPSRILRLDPETLAVQAEIPLDRKGFGLAIDDAAGRLYVGAGLDAAVIVIDTADNKVVGTIQLAEKIKDEKGEDAYPHHFRELALDPQNHRLYAPGLHPTGSSLYVVDTEAMKVEKVVPGFGYNATGIAIDPAAGRVHVSNLQGQLFAVDTGTLEIVSTVETGADQLLNLALDAEGGRLFATDQGHPRVTKYRAEALPDYQPRGKGNQVFVFSTRDGSEIRRMASGEGPVALRFDGEHRRLYVTNRAEGSISVFDTDSYDLLEKLETGAHPNSLAFDAGQNALFATVKSAEGAPKNSDESVARIDL